MSIVVGKVYCTNAHCEAVLSSSDFIRCTVLAELTTGEFVVTYRIPKRLVDESERHLIDFDEIFVCKVKDHELEDYDPEGDTRSVMILSVGVGVMLSEHYTQLIEDIKLGKIPNIFWRDD
jgi:hypothetical protein